MRKHGWKCQEFLKRPHVVEKFYTSLMGSCSANVLKTPSKKWWHREWVFKSIHYCVLDQCFFKKIYFYYIILLSSAMETHSVSHKAFVNEYNINGIFWSKGELWTITTELTVYIAHILAIGCSMCIGSNVCSVIWPRLETDSRCELSSTVFGSLAAYPLVANPAVAWPGTTRLWVCVFFF